MIDTGTTLQYTAPQAVTPRIATTYRIDDDILEGLRFIRERDGVPVSEQVRRALKAWLETRGVELKTAARRAGTRRKA